MSLFSFVGCLLDQHAPVRRDVTWDGRTYVGRCRHCGASIERYGRRKWRKRATEEQGGGGEPTPQ